jgi:ectoine hydroxylase-related dioxygenase (phytanoyl-CoA dioxygenase family)
MTEAISRVEQLSTDLAQRYKGDGEKRIDDINPAQIEADFQKLIEDGYVVIENLISHEDVATIREVCVPLLDKTGRNSFEGHLTQRLYNVLARTRAADMLVEHPRILALLDRLMMPNYLLSQAQAINILPGEQAQLLHADDGFYRLSRPRPPLGAATIWAIDDFTEQNGATLVIPGSHGWGDDRRPALEEAIPVIMPAGSAVLFAGTLWHGGGANQSEEPRLAFTCQYCEPWLRQQENFLLEIDRATAASLSDTLQSLIGYSIHPPFMGMVDGKHPKRLLTEIS